VNSLILNTKEIKELIKFGKHAEAAEKLFSILEETKNYQNKDLLYAALSLLNLISDKSPSISLRAAKTVQYFINDINSWIRLVSLEILYQISKYRPNLLIDLIDKIRARMYDRDVPVRRLAVKIMGSLILSLHIDINDLRILIEEYTEKLLDNDWKVKLQAIKTIKTILNEDYTKIPDLEPLLSIVIINLRDEDEDVARASAELLKLIGTYFLSKEKILHVLLNLLYNEETEVKEHVIKLFGEIGKEKSSEIIPFIPKLINLLKEPEYSLQMRAIEALVDIGKNNFDQIWSNLINSLDLGDQEFRNNLINTLYHLCETNLDKILPRIFEEIENPSENIRKSISLVLKRLFDEHPTEINTEIAKIFYKLESKFWRKRQEAIHLLLNLFFILKDEKLAIWILIEFNEALKKEKDYDVKKEIINCMEKITASFKDIPQKLEEIYTQIALLKEGIKRFQRMPAQFRERLSFYVNKFKFNKTEIQLKRMHDHIMKRIKVFDENVKKFEYKYLSIDLFEEWEETRVQIIEELNIIREFISDMCEVKKKEFLTELQDKIAFLEKKIEVLRVKFDHVKNYKFRLNLYMALTETELENDLEEKLTLMMDIRKHLFNLDGDIRELLIQNLEFSDIFNDLIKKWIELKIEIQKYLSEFERQIKTMKHKVLTHYLKLKNKPHVLGENKINGLDKELTLQILQGHFQSVISQAINEVKKFNENHKGLKVKLNFLIKKREYVQVKKLIELNSTQIQNFIQEIDARIDEIIGKDEIFEKSNGFTLFIRPYLIRWNKWKDKLLSKSKKFMEMSMERLYLSQIKYYLNIINPIDLEFLSSYIGLQPGHMKKLIIAFINNGKLNAKIIKNSLYSQEINNDFLESKPITLQKQLKKVGDEIQGYFKLMNPSSLVYQDIQVMLQIPSILKLKKEISYPKIFYLNDLKQGKSFEFNYVFLMDKESKKTLSTMDSQEIILNIYYKDPFNISHEKSEKISILIP